MSDPLPDPSDWFDLWHTHADFPGHGNRSARHRRAHVALLCGFFRRAARDLAGRTGPCQLWLYLDGQDAGRDAVYVHTPTPYGAPFPLWMENVRWGEPEMAALLQGVFGMPPLHVGRTADGSFMAYAAGVGMPLSAP